MAGKEIGEIDRCPYCKEKLDKIPTRKKKCPYCSKFIYVRTRPLDHKRVLVTEGQKEEIELEWKKYYEAKEYSKLMQDEEYAIAEKELAKRFGKSPSLNDLKWYVCNQRIIEYSSKRLWGFYRNNKLDMARVLEKENKFKQALSTLFEVCYLDINGCRNIPTIDGKPLPYEESKEFGLKDFDTKMAFIAPGIIDMIASLIKKHTISQSDAKNLFIDINEKTKPMKNMPVSPSQAWNKLWQELEKNKQWKLVKARGFAVK